MINQEMRCKLLFRFSRVKKICKHKKLKSGGLCKKNLGCVAIAVRYKTCFIVLFFLLYILINLFENILIIKGLIVSKLTLARWEAQVRKTFEGRRWSLEDSR